MKASWPWSQNMTPHRTGVNDPGSVAALALPSPHASCSNRQGSAILHCQVQNPCNIVLANPAGMHEGTHLGVCATWI